MKTAINLALTKQTQGSLSLYFRVIILGFGVIFLISLIMVGINIAFATQLSSLNSQEQSLMQQLQSMQDKKIKVLTVSERLHSINTVVNQRGSMDKRIESLLTVINPDMNVSAIDADDDTVTLEVQVQNLAEVKSLFDVTMKQYLKENPMKVQTVMIDSLKAESGLYTIRISFVFSQKPTLNG